MSAAIAAEAARRRTFAIISHPDAGKTTLTERLLLAAGAIRAAGAVRARGEARRTRSDWMRIERERGISVTASVLSFPHEGRMFNLLDTPGHEDFSEDTYRTLTAADCAVMVLDAAKGIEPQTLKLFEVCRLRDIPIITFINKLDREALDPFALVDEVESRLALEVAPFTWPAGSGTRFSGVIELATGALRPFGEDCAADPQAIAEAREGAELVRGATPPFTLEAFRSGHLTPVLFGSALRGFAVDSLLGLIGEIGPPPEATPARRQDAESTIEPGADEVTGFVFKVQANMDPNHRDRIAFTRLASGRFTRGMKLAVQGSGRKMSVNAPVLFFAAERELAEEAFAGDVIGIPSHGALKVGDSLSETGAVRFSGLPDFAPEILRRVRPTDPMKAKHLVRALTGLAEEGAAQLFRPLVGADLIVGAVGPLQFEVMADRLAGDYAVEAMFEDSPFAEARWVTGAPGEVEAFRERYPTAMARDIEGALVFLAKSAWEVGYAAERFPEVAFARTRERA